MDEPQDIVEQALRSSMKRRDFLTKAAAAGAIAWSAPVILSRPAYAAEVGGSPKCRPTITIGPCTIRNCPSQGSSVRNFAGIAINVSKCGCGGQNPTVCATVRNLTSSESDVVAYGPLTNCHPLSQGGVNDIFFPVPTNANPWRCLTLNSAGNATIFFGKSRDTNGMVSALGNGATVTFDLAVWAGNCPDQADTGTAHTCETFLGLQVTFHKGSGQVPDSATCGQVGQPATNPFVAHEDPSDSLCTSGNTSPCGTNCPPPTP